ncbi:MAG: hypothetical protein ACRDA3_05325 [Peptostreptococcaceae bacterium]
MDKFHIDMPSDFEIENQINNIVERGIKEKESFYSHIKNMYKEIGFRNLFHDLSELAFVGVLVISILAIFIKGIMQESHVSSESVYAYIFMISPILYFSTIVFSYANMKENNTYQVEMTCKYNTLQIASLRMLVCSIISILVNTLVIMIMSSKIIFIKGIMISTSSLFVFSSIALYSLVNIKSTIKKCVIVFGWIALNGLFYIIDVGTYNHLLSSIPTYIYGIVSICSMYLYIKNIKKLSGYEKLNFEI